jgi:tetratricopeptide (TPR) repeat protein
MRKKKRRKSVRQVSPQALPTTKVSVFKKAQDHPWLTACVLSAIVLTGIYSVCLGARTLILHEDSVLRLPVLSHVRNVPHILSRDFLLFSSGQFRPLGYVLLAVARTFVPAESPLFWHLWLVGFHIVNSVLVFGIARHFTQRIGAALIAGAVFGLHPLSTVIVNDVNQFHMLLGLTLSLGSLKAYLSFSRKGRNGLYVAAVCLFALAVVTARAALFLGVVLLAYEVLYERRGLKVALFRVSPFAVIPLSLLPLWVRYSPHPLHYKYVAMAKGSFWHGLFSVTGATGNYAGGLVLTKGIPLVLQDVVEKIYRWDSAKFLLWGAFDLLLLTAATVALRKKWWGALGILLLFVAMIPYVSVAYNRVIDYVSWSYLYFPVAGSALFVAWAYERLARARRRLVSAGIGAIFVALLLFLGGRSLELNLFARAPLPYWKHIADMNETSPTALYETGKAYLARGELPAGLHYLFAPMVEDVKCPCLAMARHYLEEGNYLAAAIHLRFGSIQEKTGIVLEEYCLAAGELLLAWGALDHAEENFGNVLMVNPFNTTAMTRLGQVWFLKGFVGEAHRILERARSLAPGDKSIALAQKELREMEQSRRDNLQPVTVTPPKPDWLRYLLTQVRSPAFRKEIVSLSETADLNDGVIQLEAMISLLEDKEYKAAARKARTVLFSLSGNVYACAAASRAFSLAGDVGRGVELGLRAVTLDTQSNLAWGSLALALALQDKPDATARRFVKAVEEQPAAASIFYHNLGLQKRRMGNNREAADLFQKSLKAEPNNVEVLQNLGDVFLQLGRYDEAIEALQKAVALNPSNAETHANLGAALLSRGKNEEGVQALKTAVELDPKDAVYHNDLGAGLARLGREAESTQEFRRAVELDPRLARARCNLANSLARVGNLPEAAEHYREAIKIAPQFRRVHFGLGTVLHRMGKVDGAISEYQEEIRCDPDFADAYSNLVTLYCKKGNYDAASDVAKRAEQRGLKLDPDVLATLRKAPRDDEKKATDGPR